MLSKQASANHILLLLLIEQSIEQTILNQVIKSLQSVVDHFLSSNHIYSPPGTPASFFILVLVMIRMWNKEYSSNQVISFSVMPHFNTALHYYCWCLLIEEGDFLFQNGSSTTRVIDLLFEWLAYWCQRTSSSIGDSWGYSRTACDGRRIILGKMVTILSIAIVVVSSTFLFRRYTPLCNDTSFDDPVGGKYRLKRVTINPSSVAKE